MSTQTIINADCLEYMKTLPDKSFDLCLTDPPYGIEYTGESRPNETVYEKIENDAGEIDYVALIAELERVADTVIIFGAENFYKALPHKGRWIVWDKRSEKLTNEVLGSPVELAWTNRTHGYYRIYRVIHGGFINADGFGRPRFHPTQKPVQLFAQIINDFTDETDTILDPFMGSGTTLIAAKQLNRNATGIEISPEYCEIARKRLEQDLLF